ncbi:putative zinc metallo proteinase [Triangularia verruculosa]|uniref:Zinc metallo proteinase n=1 Tax=Triangularia verruculosa TaxID=2587418 RepID=A0AAN6XL13_9PEZI|nr:putative zinc metallo proteinase [Triangularia verruculosa]
MEATDTQPHLDEHASSLEPSSTDSPTVEITIKFPPEQHTQTWTFEPQDTFTHLVQALGLEFPEYDWTKSKALLEKRPPALKKGMLTPSSDPSLPLSSLHHSTLRFLAPKSTALSSLQSAATQAATMQARRALARSRYARLPQSRQKTALSDANFTFHTMSVLQHLPNPAKSLSILQRLKEDPGIVHVMKKHEFSVGLLTEMDPIAHTSATQGGVSRTLGLNRNKGEVIELRLRTDRYDGWRDYKGVRKTLCHELAHNVFGPHDDDFWRLCRQIEREVEKADWNKGGRTVVEGEFAPARDGEEEEEEEMVDHGGWEGGTYVLGGNGGGGGESQGLTAREIRARAAEARWAGLERATREKEKEGGGDGGGES